MFPVQELPAHRSQRVVIKVAVEVQREPFPNATPYKGSYGLAVLVDEVLELAVGDVDTRLRSLAVSMNGTPLELNHRLRLLSRGYQLPLVQRVGGIVDESERQDF